MVVTKRKLAGSTSTSTSNKKSKTSITVEKISSLVQELNELSHKKYNNIAILLSYYEELNYNDNKDILKLRAITFGLYSSFSKLIQEGALTLKKHHSTDESLVKVIKWLKSKYATFTNKLLDFLKLSTAAAKQGQEQELLESFQIDVLQILMKLIKDESKSWAPNPNEPFFSQHLYRSIIDTLLQIGSPDEIKDASNGLNNENFLLLEFYESYFSKNMDLKFFFLSESLTLLEEKESTTDQEKQVFYSNFAIIMRNTIYQDYEQELETNYVSSPPLKQISKQNVFKSNFEKSWLIVLGFPLTPQQYKQSLMILHKRIIPFCNNPTKLMDFLTDSYDIGLQKDSSSSQDNITISILALNGLFDLMRNHNLEYPHFYENLYQILNNQLLHLAQKSRFFRMLDLFLSSTHLPSNLIASFIKRLSRLSLTAPPSGIVIVIPLIYNLLKRHPTCMIMVHNTTQYTEYTDPYDPTETNPLKTGALESSIWELSTMMNHWHPNVASLAKIFSQPFNKYSYNLEDFLDWNYTNLLESELNKRLKGDLSLEFEQFDSLFIAPSEKKENDQKTAFMAGWTW